MDIEETSAVELLFADEFDLYSEDIPLRPVGPSVWRVVITCICIIVWILRFAEISVL